MSAWNRTKSEQFGCRVPIRIRLRLGLRDLFQIALGHRSATVWAELFLSDVPKGSLLGQVDVETGEVEEIWVGEVPGVYNYDAVTGLIVKT